MRVFLGLALGAQDLAEVQAVQRELRGLCESDTGIAERCTFRWTKASQLHLTLRFLGEVEEEALAELREAVDEVRAGSVLPTGLTFSGIGAFPPRGGLSVVWLGADRETAAYLSALHDRLSEALAQRGYPKESRPFHPHITLARVKRDKTRGALRARLKHAALSKLQPQALRLEQAELVLYRSLLGPNGSQYDILHPAIS